MRAPTLGSQGGARRRTFNAISVGRLRNVDGQLVLQKFADLRVATTYIGIAPLLHIEQGIAADES